MSTGVKVTLILCSIVLGLPILACGGCLFLGVAINASITPEQREQMRLDAEQRSKESAAQLEKWNAESKERVATEATRPKPTMANYKHLQDGMTYEQVIAIVGAPSQELSKTSIAGHESVMYMWQAGLLGGNMNATFTDGRLVSKAQLNLP